MNLRTIQTLNSWPLRIAPAHSRVGEGAHLLRLKPIDWPRTVCGRNTTERRKSLKSVLRGCRAICHSAKGAAISATVAASSMRNCSTCLHKVWTYIYNSKILNRTQSLASIRLLTLAAWQLVSTALCIQYRGAYTVEPLNKGHLSNEDAVCSTNDIELCTNLPLN